MSVPSQKIRVLVVDDSMVIRRLVTDVLSQEPDIEVVGSAKNGRICLEKAAELKPDIVTMDVEMPVMNGIEAVRELHKTYPRMPVVMFSTLTERGGVATLDALAVGASDYVTKPSNVGSFAESKASVREQLVPKLRALVGARRVARPFKAPVPPPGRPPAAQVRRRTRPFSLLAIGSSTGGPDALATVLPTLPMDLPVPVLIVQHMPELFTRLLAERLDKMCPLSVVEATEGMPIIPGRVMIAPGGRHLVPRRKGTIVEAHLNDDPPENFCRPAVDVLFRGVSSVYGESVLGVVLTGMGRDGERGAVALRKAGGEILAQDEATSVVWGMPGAVTQAGQADQVLPLGRIGPEIVSVLRRNENTVGVST
jgi:two-component system, chemotaxis family, protein-glutamate methylesterase/glutaminase